MSTGKTWQTESTSSETTESFGEHIGKRLRGGEVIELSSDLGGGKTTFVRGLARGAESPNRVASPTFTISRVYDTANFRIYHFDFYRLNEAGLIAEELSEALEDDKAVVVVEWAGIVEAVPPDDRLQVAIALTPSGDRGLSFSWPAELDYVMEGWVA